MSMHQIHRLQLDLLLILLTPILCAGVVGMVASIMGWIH